MAVIIDPNATPTMSITKALLMFVRLAFVVQLVLGIAFWAGSLLDYVGIHQMLGSLFVVALWGIAIMAMRAGRGKGLAIGAIVLGLVIAGFGSAQAKIMVGDMHWVVRVAHLVLAAAAMPIAERLARMSEPASPR
ncbi:MAG: hypothetical protein ABI442_04795 [Gemmatimonadaceae bacterium]